VEVIEGILMVEIEGIVEVSEFEPWDCGISSEARFDTYTYVGV
jgi:hypothetical protein